MAELKRVELSVKQERAILVALILPKSTADPRDPLGELGSLAKTAGARVVGQVIQRRHRPESGTYIGTGKAIEIAELAMAEKADVAIFDNDLSPAQIGALETIINETAKKPRGEGIKVLDRSELILDIFASRARTSEAKLQVELAQMQYTYPRLTRMWGHLERIAGGAPAGIGTRGPGEQQLEIDRRLVRKRISVLQADIEKVQARKSRMVAERNRQHFTVCIVGYTNAGKSTLFNTLTAAGTYADDKLFATLDTKTRSWSLEHGQEVLLSDTVGFVRDLPHNLVASFKATLEEATHADLLIHVVDIGHPHVQQQFKSVHEVLAEIGAKERPELLVLNKIDTDDGAAALPEWRALYSNAIPISARTGRGLADLLRRVSEIVRGQQIEATIECDVTDGRSISFIESRTNVRQREFLEDRVFYTVFVGRHTLAELQRNQRVTINES